MRTNLLVVSCCCFSWLALNPPAQAQSQIHQAKAHQLPDASQFPQARQKWQIVQEGPEVTNCIHPKDDVIYQITIPPTQNTTTVVRMTAPSDALGGGAPGTITRGGHELPVYGFGGPSNIPSRSLYGPGSLPNGNIANHVGLEGKLNPVIINNNTGNKPGSLVHSQNLSPSQTRVDKYEAIPTASGLTDRISKERVRGWMLAPKEAK